MSLRFLAVLATLQLSEGNCPSSSITVVVGNVQVPVSIPELQEAELFELQCDELLEGYEGVLRVSCLAYVRQVRSSCVEQSCTMGQVAPARLGDSAELLPAVTRGLAHDKQEAIPCRTLKDGYHGYVILRCWLGRLSADAASCHVPVEGARQAYRLVSGEFLPGTWRVFELSFYSNPDCETGQLTGDLYGSSELAPQHRVALSADGNRSTYWSAWCPQGCTNNTVWLGLTLASAQSVRCVRLQQSKVSCCRAERLHLDVWDGAGWQRAHTWDQPVSTGLLGARLVVPMSCSPLPSSIGRVDDCDGLPIVGLKEGETCTARCAEGYVGGDQDLVCQGDGQLEGTPPSCIDVMQYTQISIYVSGGVMLVILGCIYPCVCMHGKGRLTLDVADLPKPFQGRWVESKGTTSWELIYINAQKLRAEAAAKKAKAAGFAVHEEDILKQPGQMSMLGGRRVNRKQAVDGLCSPCEDPDLCLTYTLCPLCRQADTWHTLGVPEWQTYWKVLGAYALCPWCFPCFNFYARYRLRQAFKIPLEPHRDCLVHCICCCCCTPCAHLQEARLVDAPILYFRCKHKLAQFQIREAHEKAETERLAHLGMAP